MFYMPTHCLRYIDIHIFKDLNQYNPEEPIFLPTDISENLTEYSTRSNNGYRIKLIRSLKRQIKMINKKQKVRNTFYFGREYSLAVVIKVHDSKYYLEQLIESLKLATGVSKFLLIFSHSYCDDSINALIGKISFAKVMQIFYPYSVQLHPIVFPGNDHKICETLMKCSKGERWPLLAQPKHHWWWQAAFAFDEIRFLKHYNGSVLFLEEDNYVTQDFFYILKVLERLMVTKYRVEVITLGGDARNESGYQKKHGTATLKPWNLSDYFGVVLNRHFWNKMRVLAEHFCRYKDNRWITSLINLARKSSDDFRILTIDSPRVLRFSECHGKNGSNCNVVEEVEEVKQFVKNISQHLFPQNLEIKENNGHEKIAENEKWYDARDQELCLYYSSNLKKTLSIS